MNIASTSLYNDGFVNAFSDGSKQLTRQRNKYVPQVSDMWHVLNEGETLYELANRFYGSETLFWLIADANNIVSQFSITDLVGRYLLIPNFDVYSFNAANTQNKFNGIIGELAEKLDEGGSLLPSYVSSLPLPSVVPTSPNGSGVTVIQNDNTGARAFFLMPNGGYRLMTLDIDGTPNFDIDDPTRYTNAIIFEQPL